ncbi:MAG: efflux RND transporter periplasmic adaptor subunit [Sedimentisphaerales bacterium]|nr:efflux RND transporter periplasmic adaptor subunit [Sedimentisphaerales bacterium]
MKMTRAKSLLSSRVFKTVILVVVTFLAGYVVHSLLQESHSGQEHERPGEQAAAEKQTTWTCSMHPQFHLPKPGKCPICFMDLIPEVAQEGVVGERQIAFSQEALKLMEVQTTPVERKFVEAEIRMVGKVDYDETRVKNITAWVPGRIDRLYVDFTGITVNKGDHMVDLYSPELISAQAELLQALKAVGSINDNTSDLMKRTTLATLEAARDKLRLLGLTNAQIYIIENAGEPVTHITIYSPMGGVVIHKNATEGMYVNTGTPIYTLADLSRLWVKLDAYESDLPWIRYGQEVEFLTEAYPGQVFKGKISFRDPILDAKTRTVKVRLNIDNTDGKLKPGMFVRSVLRAKVAQGGAAMDPELAGQWICPMHLSVVKDQAGTCDICEMDLVPTESLFATADEPNQPPLVIPATAPLITGKRAVVYVRIPNADKPTFEGRQVVLGPRAGDYYLVKEGLAEGEIVVTNGNFKIDSALQIQAKPSMMSAESGHKNEIFEVPDEYRRQLWGVVEKYLLLHEALASDEKEGAARAANETLEALSAVEMGLVSDKAHNVWMANSKKMKAALDKIKTANAIEPMREGFEGLSNELIAVVGQFGVYQGKILYNIHCPMAFNNKGADWLQTDEDIRNPYFGASMLKCGQVMEEIKGETN